MSLRVLSVRSRRCQEAAIPFAIDPSVFRQDARSALRLSGWAIHPHFPLREARLRRDDTVLARAPLDRQRPGARAAHAELPGSDRPGFELVLKSPAPGRYWLDVAGDAGQVLRMAEVTLEEREREQLFYLHIAKAGGSTVNRTLSRQFAPEAVQTHIESTQAWREDPMALRRFEFLSGHVGLEALDRHFELEGFRLVTVVRDPFEQLVSHLAWIRRLAEPGEEQRYANHPPYVQAFASKLAACDFTRPDALERMVASLVHEERRLVDNCQLRYFSPSPERWAGETELAAAKLASERFMHIGFAEDLDRFFTAVAAGFGWPPPPPAGRENVTSRFFGLEQAAPEVRAALAPLWRQDEQLVNFLRASRAGAPATPPGPA